MIISDAIISLVWKVFLLVLPISSFTLLSKVLGGTNVAPLAMVPMLIIIILSWIPDFFKNGRKLPYQTKPLVLFFLFGILTTLLIPLRNIPTFQGISLHKTIIDVVSSFGVGVGFYLVTVYMIRNEQQLRSTLYWISIAGIVMMAYSWIQVIAWYGLGHYPDWLYQIQTILSSNGVLFPRRATGPAFEPSWLAHALNMIYIPVWLGLCLKKKSVFEKRLFNKIQIEVLLSILAVLTLFISFSRIGWITFIFLVAYIVTRQINKLINKFIRTSDKLNRSNPRILFYRLGVWIGVCLILIIVLLIAGFVLTKIDPRMVHFFDVEALRNKGFMRWASKLVFLERVMYWIAGYRVYERFPFLGAGFGMPGYFFQSTVPVYGSQLLDINDFMLKPFFLPNTKNLWVRLLSETGIFGFALFISWLIVHWRNAAELETSENKELSEAMGLIGKLILIALLFEGFSLDTFGLPYYWVGLGLIVAAWRVRFAAPISGSPQKSD